MNRHAIGTLLLALALPACAIDEQASAGPEACSGKCDDPSATAVVLDRAIPAEAALLRLYADAGRDGTIDVGEANGLASFTKKWKGQNHKAAAFIAEVAAQDRRLTDAAVETLLLAASGDRPGDVPLDNEIYRLVPGATDFLDDDTMYLLADGSKEASTGIASHSRGYAAKRDGVLFMRHGSRAPHFASTSSLDATRALDTQGPDRALDNAALEGGIALSQFTTFTATAHSPAYYDPSSNTPAWAGICQGWTHNALDNRLSNLVDVAGSTGQRGVWIFGQWLSRADLGNQLMAVSYSLGIADSITIDSFVKPETLLKAVAQHVMTGGQGLRVDIWNDEHNASGVYNPQIWNQPIVSGRIDVQSVTPAVRNAVYAHAVADPKNSWQPAPADASVKLVRVQGRWGAETNDSWEKEARFRTSDWNMYVVTAADGRVVRGYMAHTLVLAGVQGLPVMTSDGVPDYLAVPRHELTDAAFEAGPHRLLDPSNHDGVRFRFLVGTVLARGIPNVTRRAFEADVLTASPVDPVAIAARYPGIANAYSREQWQRVFEPRLGAGAVFGAVWGQGAR